MSSPSDSIAPGLLLAMPQLADPNFHHAVVLMTAHGADGAMGFVVNRQLPAPMKEVLEELDITWGGHVDDTAWLGGPVMQESGWILYDDDKGDTPDDAAELMPGVKITASIEALRRMAGRPPARFRLLLGHAGWEAGQLEREIVEGAWMLVPASPELIFETPAEDMWETAYRSLGVDPGSIVPGGGVQ